jgi:hypothetical protein
MRNYLLYGLAAAILFAVSASISLWLQNRNKDSADKARAAANTEADPGEAMVLPRSVKPAGDEASQALASLHDREKALRERETALGLREKKMELIAQDLQKERADLEVLQKQIQDTLRDVSARPTPTAVRKSDIDIDILRDTAARDEPQIRVGLRDSGPADGADVAHLAFELERTAPEVAARRLKDMAQQGNPDRAMMVLAKMESSAQDRVRRAMDAVPGTEAPRTDLNPAPATAPVPMPPPVAPPPAVVPTVAFPIR